ncbi:MAG: ATP-binding cassette domain-containing protein [Actinomycetales bacterium]|nr:ATP-binding cassette domain-containing protein [Actinomycetales bacterium]
MTEAERTVGTPAARQGMAVTARGVVVVRGGRRVVDDVDVDLVPGRILAVTGPSGSGKSTLLAVLAGLVLPDAGSVEPPDRAARAGVVFQGYGLLPVLTAAENVELPLQLRGLDRAAVREGAEVALARAGLPDVPDRLAEELSGGQRQRVAVARALALGAALLVADEPTAELDADSAALVLGAIRAEADAGAAVVLATHDPDVAALCDTRLHLVDGRATAEPAP